MVEKCPFLKSPLGKYCEETKGIYNIFMIIWFKRALNLRQKLERVYKTI